MDCKIKNTKVLQYPAIAILAGAALKTRPGAPSRLIVLAARVIIHLAIVIIVTGLVLYLKPEARERVFRVVGGARARLPVWLGGRSREDTTLLVSDGRMTSSGFGAMSEEFS